MQIAVRIAGYSMGQADELRRVMAKKNARAGRRRARTVRRRVRRAGTSGEARQGSLRPHRALRRLWVPRGARLRVRAHRVPDRVPEAAPPARVHVGAADERRGRQGQQALLPERRPHDGHPRPAARRERVGRALRAGRRGRALRPGRDPQRGRGGGPADHPGAQRERAVRIVPRLLREGRARRAAQEDPREPDPGGGVRLGGLQATGAARGLRQGGDADPRAAPRRGRRPGVVVRRRRRRRARRDRRGPRGRRRRVRHATICCGRRRRCSGST